MKPTSRAFRLESWMTVLGVVAFAAVAIIAAGIGIAGSETQGVLPVGLVGAFVFGALAFRYAMLRVEFDANHLIVVGMLRTRTIPRTQVVDVSRSDLWLPVVIWVDAAGRTRWTPLIALQLDTTGIFVAKSLVMRRRRFLDQLAGWARGPSGRDTADSGLAKAIDVAERAFAVTWTRYLAALLVAAAAVSLYAWSWTLTIDIVETGAATPRRFGSTFVIAGILGSIAAAVWPRLSSDARYAVGAVIVVLCVAPFVVVSVRP